MLRRSLPRLLLASVVPLPALGLRLGGVALSPYTSLFVYGAAVVSAALLLAWAAETAQLDISGSLAIAALAFIAVLPEYAVDLYFAYTAGHDPSYAPYAAANMTGSNRLLLGFGWPLVALVAALSLRQARKRRAKISPGAAEIPAAVAEAFSAADSVLPEVPPEAMSRNREIAVGAQQAVAEPSCRAGLQLTQGRRIELMFLGIAAVYSFVIPIFRKITLWDGVILLLIYCVYLWRVAKEEREEPELIGVSAYVGSFTKPHRRACVLGMFVGAAIFILASAEPFAEALIATGRNLGIDEFLLVQWLAPLVSESPELIVACLLAWRLKGNDAIGALLSSKVNQWTLLVGTIPFAYLAGGGHLGSLPLDMRQTEEFILTAAQTVLGFAVLLNLRFEWKEAVMLAVLFFLQFPFPQTSVRLGFSALYLAIALLIVVRERKHLRHTVYYAFGDHGRAGQISTARTSPVPGKAREEHH